MVDEFTVKFSFLAVEAALEGGAQPLDAALALVGAAAVALAQHALGDELEDVFALGAALEALLHVRTGPDVEQRFGLRVAPDHFPAVRCPRTFVGVGVFDEGYFWEGHVLETQFRERDFLKRNVLFGLFL